MAEQQPTPSKLSLLGQVGLSFFFLVLPVRAQMPAPQESGRQLVRRAESLLQQATPGQEMQALSLYQTAAVVFQQAGEIEAAALAWHRISQLATQSRLTTQARSAAAKARTLLRLRTLPTRSAATLSTSQAARAYLTLGRIHLESGEVKAAIEAYQTGLSLAVAARLHREAAAGHVALGLMAAQADEFDTAIQMTLRSLDFWRAAKDFGGEAMALNNLARFYERKGDLRQAADFDTTAVNLMRFSRNHKGESDSLVEAMRLHLIMGNYEEAAFACEQLIGLAQLNGDQPKERERLFALALLEARRDNLPSAYRLLLKAFIGSAQASGETEQQIKQLVSKLEAAPKPAQTQKGREQLLAEAEFETNRGDFSAAYQLLLRALLMNEGKSDALNAALNLRIKNLAKQIEARQRKLSATRPARFE